MADEAIISTPERRIPICGSCHSQNVLRDAWAEWDVFTQKWVINAVFDHAVCNDCESETNLVMIVATKPN